MPKPLFLSLYLSLYLGAMGAMTALLIGIFTTKVHNLNYVHNGLLCGLVAVTAPCALMDPWAAIIVGALGGFGYVVKSTNFFYTCFMFKREKRGAKNCSSIALFILFFFYLKYESFFFLS